MKARGDASVRGAVPAKGARATRSKIAQFVTRVSPHQG